MEENRLSNISKADSDEKMGEFWDSHDFTDFDTDAPDVHFEVTHTIPVAVELFSELEKQAQKRGVKVETLVNLWLQQKLDEEEAA
jgi:CopG antitoxin of type II toxin-antitoxin system